MTLYEKMLKESDRIGWPRAFKTDLTKHDRAYLENNPANRFVWIIRECGTHIIPLEIPRSGTREQKIRELRSYFDWFTATLRSEDLNVHCYIADGGTLTEVEPIEAGLAITKFVSSVRFRDIRGGSE